MVITGVAKAQEIAEIRALQREKLSLIYELDTLKGQISDQRSGKNIVLREKVDLEGYLHNLNSVLEATKYQLEEAQRRYYSLTDDQRSSIAKLDEQILNRKKQLDEYNAKTIIDIDSINAEYKKKIAEQQTILQSISSEVSTKQSELQGVTRDIGQHKALLKKEREDIEQAKTELSIQATALKAFEKQLKKLSGEVRAKRRR